MKAEHRKELPTNVVYERVGRFFHDMRTNRPSSASLLFVIAIVAIVGLAVGWYFIHRAEVQTLSSLWVKFNSANTAEDLETLAKDNAATQPGRMARFEEARMRLRKGLEKYCSFDEKERTEARENIKTAGALYERLAAEVKEKEFPLLAEEALMGAAKAKESENDLDGALKLYKQLAGRKPETDVVKEAAKAAKDLEDPANREKIVAFYQKLNEMSAPLPPPPPLPPMPTPVPGPEAAPGSDKPAPKAPKNEKPAPEAPKSDKPAAATPSKKSDKP